MGVKGCLRNGCESIMCDRYSHKHGYICPECFNELVALNPISIDEFMQSPRRGSDLSEDAEAKFDREFPVG